MKPRALRADAERNRRRVLEVAQTVFATEGLAVPIDEIARRAGLGVGTLYRHFPTKEALFAAIIVTRMEDVIADARALPETEAAAEAFFEFMTRMVDGWTQKKYFIDALSSAGIDLKEVARAKHELVAELGKLLERAQATGSVRTDVSMGEILALIAGAFTSVERQGISTAGRERMLAVIFAGLRTSPSPSRSRRARSTP